VKVTSSSGPDSICERPATGKFDYGFLPPRFFNELRAGFQAWRSKRKGQMIAR
jgi:hypothetical protein